MISEKDCIVSDDRRLSETFNGYFINITKTVDLKPHNISTTTSLSELTKTFEDKILALTKNFSLRREKSQFKFQGESS